MRALAKPCASGDSLGRRAKRAEPYELAGEVLADSTRALRVLETSHPPTIYLPPAQRHSETSLPVLSESSYHADGRAFGRPRVSLAGNPAVDRVSRKVSLRLDEARVAPTVPLGTTLDSGRGHWWSKYSFARKRQWPAA
jgi:Domain of unknown function (DUF427)